MIGIVIIRIGIMTHLQSRCLKCPTLQWANLYQTLETRTAPHSQSWLGRLPQSQSGWDSNQQLDPHKKEETHVTVTTRRS